MSNKNQKIREALSKKLSFQQQLPPSEYWSDQRFLLFEQNIPQPTDDSVMLGFLRHTSLINKKQKQYIQDTLGVSEGIQQKWELDFENHMRSFWNKSPVLVESDPRQQMLNSSQKFFPELPNKIAETLADLKTRAAKIATEITSEKNKKKLILAESDLINLYTDRFTKTIPRYTDLLTMILSHGLITDILIGDDKNRYFVLNSLLR